VILRSTAGGHRPGLTLLEVLVALAIFLLSLAAISQLVTSASKRALEARQKEETSRLARSKFAEVYAGVVPLTSSEDTPFDEDPDYTWSLTADNATMTGLWAVTVTVKRKGEEGPGFSLQEYLLDPTIRGSTQDTVVIMGASNSSSNSNAPSSSSQSSSSQAVSGGAMPATKAPAASTPAKAPTGGGGAGGGGAGGGAAGGGRSGGGSSPPAGGGRSGGGSMSSPR